MLVAGIDSSTQSCKVLVLDTETGLVVRQASAPHPAGTSVNPIAWWDALKIAIERIGGLQDVEAIGVGGQQHGMVLLDREGEVVRDALLWNDTSSAPQASRLVDTYGEKWWAEEVGSVPVASFTITKLAWVAQNDSDSAQKAQAVCLPHDYLTYLLKGGSELVKKVGLENSLTTDRGDASGTGYWSTKNENYLPDLIIDTFGKHLITPKVLGPWDQAGKVDLNVAANLKINPSCIISAGSGDNMAAALGIGILPSQGVVSIGTSGTVFASTDISVHDTTGLVAGFADATGNYLPLVCTLNATQILDTFRSILNVDFNEFDDLAMNANPGSDGLTLIPFFQGERTPNLPNATGFISGMTLSNTFPANLARMSIEGVICSLNDALLSLINLGVQIETINLIGGGAASTATQHIASEIFKSKLFVPQPAEYVALGMARQAAKCLGTDINVSAVKETKEVLTPKNPIAFENYKASLSKVY
jgi:xylulokinase